MARHGAVVLVRTWLDGAAMTPGEYELKVLERIAANGFTYIGVFDPEGKDPTFVYSLGNTERGWPELILIGNMNMRTTEALLNQIQEVWQGENKPVLGDIPNMIVFQDGTEHPLRLVEVDAAATIKQYAYQVQHFYPDVPHRFVQVLWPDKNGRFPNDAQYDHTVRQPQLPVVS